MLEILEKEDLDESNSMAIKFIRSRLPALRPQSLESLAAWTCIFPEILYRLLSMGLFTNRLTE